MPPCRKGLQKTILKIKGKKAGLYVKSMFGTHALGQRTKILKTSALSRELYLLKGLRIVTKAYQHFVSIGMLQWPSYKKEVASMDRVLQLIHRSIQVYRKRRLEAGLFSLKACSSSDGGVCLKVHSPLLLMPLQEALKILRQKKKKRNKESSRQQ